MNATLSIGNGLGHSVFFGWPSVEVNVLLGTVYVTFYPGLPPSWPEYEGCAVLTVPTPPGFSYHFDLTLYHQTRKGLVWSIAVV